MDGHPVKITSPAEWLESMEEHWASLSLLVKNMIFVDLILLLILGVIVLAMEPAGAQDAPVVYFNPPLHTLTDGTTANSTDVNGNFNGEITDGNAAIATIQASLAGLGPVGMPSGAVIMINNTVCPPNYHTADGTSGTADLRGVFVRGLGGTSGALGVLVPDQMHTHTHGSTGYVGSISGAGDKWAAGISTDPLAAVTSTGGGGTTTNMTSGSPGTETRPANVVFLHCQKS